MSKSSIRMLRTAGFVLATALGGVGAAPAPVVAAALPDGRRYEMVSPADKNGGDIFRFLGDTRSAVDGNRVLLSSSSAFGDARNAKGTLHYLATRGETGWSTRFPSPRIDNDATGGGTAFLELLSPDLREYVMTAGDPDPVSGATTGLRHLYRGGEGTSLAPLAPLGTPLEARAVGASADFRHIVFESPNRLTSDAPIDEPTGDATVAGASNVYENVDGVLRLVSILPDGTPAPSGSFAGYYPGSGVGGATAGTLTQDQHVVSLDGSRIFWTSVADGQLYARINGRTTVHVSESRRTTTDVNGPRAARFRYATPTGSRVFFTSPEKLTDDASADSTSVLYEDLYMYDMGTSRLTDISVGAPVGEFADVQGVVGASDDGSTVYFAAIGHLTPDSFAAPDEDSFGLPRPKIYRWHDGTLAYVTTMGTLFDSALEGANWGVDNNFNGVKSSAVSADGRFMVVRSVLPLTSFDSAGRAEFYRYDADERSMICISCGPSGTPSDASLGVRSLDFGSPWLQPFQARGVSSGASRVFFESAASLVPHDTNGRVDVYEWQQGALSLISSGTSPYDSHFADASPSGDDVFFTTRERLVGDDEDNNVDLYDARVDGGFPRQLPVVCAGDDCQPAPGEPSALPSPSSTTVIGRGNTSSRSAARRRRPIRLSVTPLTSSARVRFAETGRVVLRVAASRSGTVVVTARAKLRGRSVIVGKVSKHQDGTKFVRLRLAISKAALRAWHGRHRVAVSLTVAMTGAKSRVLNVTLTSRSR